MALTEETFIDKIEVIDQGNILVREVTVVKRDGVELARTYHRTNLEPGSDTSSADSRVQAIAAVVWTPEVLAAYQVLLNQPMFPTEE